MASCFELSPGPVVQLSLVLFGLPNVGDPGEQVSQSSGVFHIDHQLNQASLGKSGLFSILESYS